MTTTLLFFILAACTVSSAALGSGPAKAPEGTPHGVATTDYFPPPESQGGWRKLDTPQDIRKIAGMDPGKLDELKEWLLQSDKRDFAAVVIRRGCIVLEVERGNSAKTDSRRVASVSKAVCATVLAIASQQSQEGLTPKKMKFDDPAFQFIPWAQPLSDPRKAQITVRQLLNHTSGLCPEATGAKNDGTWEYVLGHSGDPHTAQLAFDPGTACGYSTHAFHHAALVCETVTGKPYDRFAIEALFKPLGIEHWWFQYFDGGQKIGRHPTHGLGIPARDLARIGYCMLHGGRWGDRQIIPAWFVEETAAPTHNVKTPEMRWKLNPQIFSHGWQLPARHSAESGHSAEGIPADARDKPGSGGQYLAFVPSLDLVIARQTGSSGEWTYEEYLRRACAAVALLKAPEKTPHGVTTNEVPEWFPEAAPLPPPQGEVIRATTVDEIFAAVERVRAGGTILLADGHYRLPRVIVLQGKKGITIRSAGGDPDKVTLSGRGWDSSAKGDDILHIGRCEGVTIADLTFADCRSYGIKVESENAPRDVHIYNCRFRDIGVRAIKGSAGQDPNVHAVKGSVRYCRFENTKVPPADWLFGGDYIAAIDMMALEDWTFGDNIFWNIKGRNGGGRAAIFIWVRSRRVVVERNLIVNCDRGVAFGNPGQSTANVAGEQLVYVCDGVIRNNFIVGGPDCGIELWYVQRIRVCNNSIWRPQQNWGRGIRIGTGTCETDIVNNLVHGEIRLDGGQAQLRQNLAGRLDGYFVDPTSGNLALTPAATGAIDGGVSLPEVADDIRGRPRSGPPDLGAWEFDKELSSRVEGAATDARAAASSTSAAPDAADTMAIGPIRLHPDNPHYFSFRGRPTILITAGEHYGAVMNLDFDYVRYLDELRAGHFNLTRVFSGTYREVPGSFGIVGNTLAPAKGRFVCPWARSRTPGASDGGCKFDLTRWDEAYFDRLKDFAAQAARRGIVVELVLFCTMYDENIWNASPMNARNNISSIGDVARNEVYSARDKDLLAAQEAVVRKLVTELSGFDNLYYEVCNEPYERGGLTKEWNDRVIAAIVETEASLPSRHLIAQGFPPASTAVSDLSPHVSILNFHAAKPDAVRLNYHLNRVVAFDETGGGDRSDSKYRIEGWEFILAGGGVYDHLDFSFTPEHEDGTAVTLPSGTPGGGGPELRRQLRILKEFVEGFDLVRMAPDNTIIKEGRVTGPAAGGSAAVPKGTMRALVSPGEVYAVYVHGGTGVELVLELPAGAYKAEWVNTKTGRIDKMETAVHAGGQWTLASPTYSEDISLRVARQASAK